MTRLFRCFLIALVAFQPVLVYAVDPVIKLAPNTKWTGTVPATKVTITVNAAGVPTVIVDPATPITVTGTGGGIQPDPTNPPADPSLTKFEKMVAKLTEEALQSGGTSTTAAAISSVFSLVSDSVGNSSIPPEKALDAVGAGIRLVMTRVTDDEKWAAFRQTLGDALDALRQDGSLKTAAEYSAVLQEVANGMNSVTGFNGSATLPAQDLDNPNAGLFDKINIAQIIELIKLLLELFKTFSP